MAKLPEHVEKLALASRYDTTMIANSEYREVCGLARAALACAESAEALLGEARELLVDGRYVYADDTRIDAEAFDAWERHKAAWLAAYEAHGIPK